jgi:DNA transformation protein
MPKAHRSFADYCCELLASLGPCTARAMFGGFGLSVDGLTVAIVADLGSGERLWLKASDDTRAQFEQSGSQRFTYDMGGVPKGMNYFTVPEDAMDSPAVMAPWARLALQAALAARQPARKKPPKPKNVQVDKARAATKSIAKAKPPAAKRPLAEAAKPSAPRKSRKS